MTDWIAFNQLRFAPDFASALGPKGQRIRISKYERALLKHFTAHPQQLIGRNRLLDVIGGETLDRNVDYLVSRLRRKLGDSAKKPRFIATQYGEGYRWIATPTAMSSNPIFLLIGPILGLKKTGDLAGDLDSLLKQLRDSLAAKFDHNSNVQISLATPENCMSASLFSLELSFIQTRKELRCSSVLRDGSSGYIHQCWQHTIDPSLDKESVQKIQSDFAQEIYSKVLTASVHKPAVARRSGEAPLPVALYQAADLFSDGGDKYQQVSDFLSEKLAANPDDHHTAILLASSLHLQLLCDSSLFNDTGEIEPLMSQIDALVIEHLQGIQDEPLFLSSAAKLLYFVGHLGLAEELAERALDLGPNFAATQIAYAQIKMFQGELDYALEYYDYALERCEPDSQFYSVILALKATNLRAAGDKASIPKLVTEIGPLDKNALLELNMYLLGDLAQQDPVVAEIAPTLSTVAWRVQLRRLYYITARQFQRREHRERVMDALVGLAISYGGNSVLIDEIRKEMPNLCR